MPRSLLSPEDLSPVGQMRQMVRESATGYRGAGTLGTQSRPSVGSPGPARKPTANQAPGGDRKVAEWWHDPKQQQDVLASLVSKVATVESTGATTPGNGAISWGALPRELAEQLAPMVGGNPLGWVPSKLNAKEAQLLTMVVGKEQQRRAMEAEARARAQQQPQQVAGGMPQGQFAGQMP